MHNVETSYFTQLTMTTFRCPSDVLIVYSSMEHVNVSRQFGHSTSEDISHKYNVISHRKLNFNSVLLVHAVPVILIGFLF